MVLVILIVDDSKIIVERIISLLDEMPSEKQIIVAYNYEQGKELLEKYMFDVAVLDINLPDKSGIDLLRLIRQKNYQIKKIIVMTEDALAEKKELCMELGAHFFLNKFSDFDSLPIIISDL